tara:strand:+ start:1417 stop:1722 length:306 start_codon:yes stop_codon:yes gene_type:complete
MTLDDPSAKWAWQYRAMDSNMNIVEGEIHANTFEQLVIVLRQQHQLQIIQAIKADASKSANLDAKVKRLEEGINFTPQEKPKYIISQRPSWWIRLLSVFVK